MSPLRDALQKKHEKRVGQSLLLVSPSRDILQNGLLIDVALEKYLTKRVIHSLLLMSPCRDTLQKGLVTDLALQKDLGKSS